MKKLIFCLLLVGVATATFAKKDPMRSAQKGAVAVTATEKGL